MKYKVKNKLLDYVAKISKVVLLIWENNFGFYYLEISQERDQLLNCKDIQHYQSSATGAFLSAKL